MRKLDLDFRANTAKTLTELAIQNKLIPEYSDPNHTATVICDFFKTIVNNLDAEDKD